MRASRASVQLRMHEAIVAHVQERGGCDAGAYELGGGAGFLEQGGMNGTWFNAATDGHYVSVQRITPALALVTWTTFDKNGAQRWIYGVGDVDGRHIHVAKAAQNVGGVLQPGGAPSGSHADVWGALDLDFDSCTAGQFAYDSALREFGSGKFALNRLSMLDDLGCSD